MIILTRFQVMNRDGSVEERYVLPSDMESLLKVEEVVDKVCADYGIPEDAYGNVLIAVTEALNNAIIHGNGGVRQKNVELVVREDVDSVVFEVKDEGAGFDYLNLPDPTAPENLEKPNGRGVFLMRSLADEVEFYDNGSRVELRFKL
jgi:serine/threonine-protein kinase RsbW